MGRDQGADTRRLGLQQMPGVGRVAEELWTEM